MSAQDMPEPSRSSRVLKVFFWIGTIWLAGWLGIIVTGAVSNTDVLQGAEMGAMNGIVLSPLMLIVTLPLGLLGWGIGTWNPLRRWRLWISLALPVLLPFSGIVGAAKDRLDPGRRFTRLTGVAFPASAKVVHWEFSGGGFADLLHTYELICTPEETDRLIRELKLAKNRHGMSSLGWSSGVGTVVGSGAWRIHEVWSGNDAGHADFVEIQLDASRTRLRLICGTI